MRYAVDIGGNIVKWSDGKLSCDDEKVLSKIKDVFEEIKNSQMVSISLDGELLYMGEGVDAEKSWVLSYGVLQDLTGGRMKFVAGDKPSWKALGFEAEDNVVY